MCTIVIDFYRATQLGLGSRNSVRLSVSVGLSVTRVLRDKTKQCTADILIPHETAFTLVF